MPPRPEVITDSELLAAAATGDRQAFCVFMRRHQAGVYRYLQLLGSTPSEGEDATQETFLSAFRSAADFRDGSARSWLLTIARRRLFRDRRPTRRETVLPLFELGCAAGWGQTSAPEMSIDRFEHRQQLIVALRQLTQEDREVLLVRDLEGLSGKEAASLLQLDLATMKSRLHRARLRLAAALHRIDRLPETTDDG